VIVPVPLAVAIVAFVAEARLIVKVSSISSLVSPFIVTLIVLEVSPGLKVKVVVEIAT